MKIVLNGFKKKEFNLWKGIMVAMLWIQGSLNCINPGSVNVVLCRYIYDTCTADC